MVSLTLAERMSTVRFKVDDEAHIKVNPDVCRNCTVYICTYVCPANLYVLLDDGSILFNYEECFECGTCYIACNQEGAIEWSYPKGGYGVTFREA